MTSRSSAGYYCHHCGALLAYHGEVPRAYALWAKWESPEWFHRRVCVAHNLLPETCEALRGFSLQRIRHATADVK